MADKSTGEGKLGFGYMRLPRGADGFDEEQVSLMVDRFLEYGFTYFDTAFIYPGSEDALRKSLVQRYPRSKFKITTKLAIMGLSKAEEQEAMLQTSLSRLGVDFVDSYFIHGLDDKHAELADRLDTWGFMQSVKQRGLASHIGLSFHGSPEYLDKVLSEHPEMEYVQLQINYLDWKNPLVRSKELYDVARKHRKIITVMEPCKGGLLAGTGSIAFEILSSANRGASSASWAFRFVLGLEGIETILSGMCDLSQMEDNAKTFLNFEPLSESEMNTLLKAVEALNTAPRVPCTGCNYCVPHCPKKISIPTFIELYNDYLVHKSPMSSIYKLYTLTSAGIPSPSDCVGCGLCCERCPQHISITDVFEAILRDISPHTAIYMR